MERISRRERKTTESEISVWRNNVKKKKLKERSTGRGREKEKGKGKGTDMRSKKENPQEMKEVKKGRRKKR